MALLSSIDFDFDQSINVGGPAWRIGQVEDIIPPWVWVDAFTSEQCDSITAMADRLGLRTGRTGSEGQTSRRKSSVCFLQPSPMTHWVFDRLGHVVIEANKYFDFEIDGFYEGAQFTRYEPPNGHYDWHVDRGTGLIPRKLSITIPMNDPEGYEGGVFEINHAGGDPEPVRPLRGQAIVFPSWSLHRVTPVTSGVRDSLVVWVTGPPFK